MASVKLRPIRSSDATICFRWLSDPDVLRYLGQPQAPASQEAKLAWIVRATADGAQQRVFIIENDSGRAIGTCGLRHISQAQGHASLGILIGEKALWDQGYGAAALRSLIEFAFHDLGLRQVQLTCHRDNRRALRCYQKVGFRRLRSDLTDRQPARAEVRMVLERERWREVIGSGREG